MQLLRHWSPVEYIEYSVQKASLSLGSLSVSSVFPPDAADCAPSLGHSIHEAPNFKGIAAKLKWLLENHAVQFLWCFSDVAWVRLKLVLALDWKAKGWSDS